MNTTTTTACSCNGKCRRTPGALVETVEAIRKRQTARLLDHLRQTGQCTPRLEGDVCRAFSFAFDDVKDVVNPHHEQTTETPHAKRTR